MTDREVFEDIIQAFRVQIANVGAHGVIDGATRAAYDRQILAMAAELRQQALNGTKSWAAAADEASGLRNVVMEMMRGRSTPVGRALAESLKRQGRTLNELVARKTIQLFGRGAVFDGLTVAQQNRVYAAIVESAGKSNMVWTARMKTVSRAGKGLLILSLAISVYNVATADDKVAAAKEEAIVTGAGIGGGIAGGALAGLACGPGAPVCVGVGAFVGGVAAAFGVSLFF